MNLSIGIVGLQNVGKSTLFNALMKRKLAQTANYPFTTVKPNTGVVVVRDKRLEKLSELIKPEKVTPAAVTFADIAGLVKNAHKGEGLGNEFLGYIRNVDAIVHVVREFENVDVAHVMGSVDSKRDREIINLELELSGIRKLTIEWINKDKEQFEKVEELIRQTYIALDLITFYTIKGGKEVRAWSLKKGSTAFNAAEKVHTDFVKKFIKAEVIQVDELLVHGSWKKAKELGKVRIEGRDYIVKDGDVIEFKIGA